MCLCGISSDFSLLSPSIRQVTHVLLTRPPLDNVSSGRSFPIRISFDLHVLGTPPAFILSQDRTLIMSIFHKEKYVMYKTTAQAVPCVAGLRTCFKARRRSYTDNLSSLTVKVQSKSKLSLACFSLITVKVCFRCTFLCF